MPKFLRDNLLIIVMLSAMGLACLAPDMGKWLHKHGLVPWLVVGVFLCQGAAMEHLSIKNLTPYLRSLLCGFVVCHALAPWVAFAMVNLLGWHGDDRVGFFIITCMSPTLASGVVIAAQAGGDRTLALMLTVVLTLAGVLCIPFNLRWVLGAEVALNPLELLGKLSLTVLLPGVIGQTFRWRLPATVKRHGTLLKQLPIFFLGVTVLISISQQADAIMHLTWRRVLELAIPSLTVHYALLGVAWFGGGWLKLGFRQRRAVAIVASQKTLPVAVAVWAGAFAKDFPLALVPCIVFHLAQIYGDGLIANWWAKREPLPETAEAVADKQANAARLPGLE